MSFTPIEDRPRTTGCRIKLLATGSLLLFGLFGLLFTISGRPATPNFELFPKHFRLRPGERIHYNVCPSEAVERYLKGELPRGEFHCVDAKFSTEDPNVLRLIPERTIKNGEETAVDGVLEAVRSGRTNLVVSTPNSEQRFTITVAGAAQPSFKSVPHTAVKEIKAKEFVFVGHADLDGFDFTAAAKRGIDRVVAEARKNRVPVVYWVSNEYPNWYTSDRQPDYAFVSEGQEHEIHVDSERVTFTGGSFMMCVLRNVQMTLHGMLKHDAQRVHFIFPAEAIWVEDLDRGAKRWYPAPAVVLSERIQIGRCSSNSGACEPRTPHTTIDPISDSSCPVAQRLPHRGRVLRFQSSYNRDVGTLPPDRTRARSVSDKPTFRRPMRNL